MLLRCISLLHGNARAVTMAAANAAMVMAAVMAATAELRAMSLAMRQLRWRRWWCGWRQQHWLPWWRRQGWWQQQCLQGQWHLIRYYLQGLGTLCVPNHVDYTCSCVMWFRLYGRRSTNSYVTFPKARNHLKAKKPNHSCVIGLHRGVVLCRHLVEI